LQSHRVLGDSDATMRRSDSNNQPTRNWRNNILGLIWRRQNMVSKTCLQFM
jgi:hypothetical protein